MSTPLMPEWPEVEVHRATWDDGVGWSQYHDERDPLPKVWDDEPPDEVCGFVSVDRVRAYGLAVWKAAMEQAAKECDWRAEKWDGPFSRAAVACSEAIRSLPLPESDMTQARGE